MASVTLKIKIDLPGLRGELETAVKEIVSRLEPIGDVEVDIDTKGAKSALDGIQDEVDETGRKADITREKFAQWGMILAGYQAALQSISQFWDALTQPLDVAGEFEQFNVQFEVLLGNQQEALERMKELTEFAEKTPFELGEIVDASRQLEVLTRGALSTGKGLQLVGDVAAGTGQRINELATWFGRLYDGIQSGRPVGEALMRLQELGIVSGDVRSEIEKLQKANADANEVWGLVVKSMDRFNGMMEKQSETYGGMKSNLEDSLMVLQKTFGELLLPTAKEVLSFAINSVGFLTQQVLGLNTANKSTTDIIREQQTEFNVLVNTLKQENLSLDTKKRLIDELKEKYPEYLKNIDLEKATIEDIAKWQKEANDEFERSIKQKAAEEIITEQTNKIVKLQKDVFESRKLIESLKLKMQELSKFEDANINFSVRKNIEAMRIIIATKEEELKEQVKLLDEYKSQYSEFLGSIEKNTDDSNDNLSEKQKRLLEEGRMEIKLYFDDLFDTLNMEKELEIDILEDYIEKSAKRIQTHAADTSNIINKEINSISGEYQKHFSFLINAIHTSTNEQMSVANQLQDYMLSLLEDYLAQFIATKIAEATVHEATETEKTVATEEGAIARIAIMAAEIAKTIALAAANVLVAIAEGIASLFSMFGPFAIPLIGGMAAAAIAAFNGVKELLGFQTGGFTGDGSPDEPAGIVHKKEFVFESALVSREPEKFQLLHSLLKSGITLTDIFMGLANAVNPIVDPRVALAGINLTTPVPASISSQAEETKKIKSLLTSIDDRLRKIEEKDLKAEVEIKGETRIKDQDIYISWKRGEKKINKGRAG